MTKTLHNYDDVYSHIRDLKTFQTRDRPGAGRHVQAEWRSDCVYVVYSYGAHYPMFVYDKSIDRWYENKDKSSRTTERHKRRFGPGGIHSYLSTEDLKTIIAQGGFIKAIAERVSAP